MISICDEEYQNGKFLKPQRLGLNSKVKTEEIVYCQRMMNLKSGHCPLELYIPHETYVCMG